MGSVGSVEEAMAAGVFDERSRRECLAAAVRVTVYRFSSVGFNMRRAGDELNATVFAQFRLLRQDGQ